MTQKEHLDANETEQQPRTRRLFFVRHGQDYQGDLDETGRQQIARLASYIRNIIGNSSTYIISSTADRACQSAEILAESLKVPQIETHSFLWSGGGSGPTGFNPERTGHIDQMAELINNRRDRAENLVVVTHYEVVDTLPDRLADQEEITHDRLKATGKGQAYYLDLENKTVQMI